MMLTLPLTLVDCPAHASFLLCSPLHASIRLWDLPCLPQYCCRSKSHTEIRHVTCPCGLGNIGIQQWVFRVLFFLPMYMSVLNTDASSVCCTYLLWLARFTKFLFASVSTIAGQAWHDKLSVVYLALSFNLIIEDVQSQHAIRHKKTPEYVKVFPQAFSITFYGSLLTCSSFLSRLVSVSERSINCLMHVPRHLCFLYHQASKSSSLLLSFVG